MQIECIRSCVNIEKVDGCHKLTGVPFTRIDSDLDLMWLPAARDISHTAHSPGTSEEARITGPWAVEMGTRLPVSSLD